MSKKIIEKLCNLNGISGHESKISEFLFDIFNENNLEVSKDNIQLVKKVRLLLL